MALRHFRTASLMGNSIQLEFEPEGAAGFPLAITVPLENASHLVAGLLNALRAAEQQGSQIPAVQLTSAQTISVTVLPVDQWRVTTADELPRRALLHLLAAGGLFLTYSFGTDVTQMVGEALAATAEAPQIDHPSGSRH